MNNTKSSDLSAGSVGTQTGSQVLYVDPDQKSAASVVTALEEQIDALSVAVATSSAEALSLVATQPVECIISEYTLSDGSGFDLLETVRNQYDKLPFIVYTADGSEMLASDAFSVGVTDYIPKHHGESETRLASTVATVLAKHRATRQISEAQADEFQALVDGIKDHAIFLLDPQGYVTSWNSGAEHLEGYRQEEIVGEHFSTFYPAEATEREKPADMLAKARTRGRAAEEGWRVRKDGSQFWASVVITALRDDDGTVRGFAKFTRDLTEQRERERQLREQHGLTERILDTVPVGVAVHTPDGALIRANQRAQDILTLVGTMSSDESQETGIETIYDADGEPMDEADLPPVSVFETGEPISDIELALERSDGTLRWLSVNSVPMYEPNGDDIERIITTGQDITARKEREQDLKATQRELQATVDDLAETNRRLEVTQNRFKALTENSSVGVVSIDGTSTVQFANDRIEEIFGYEPDELVGESLATVMPDRLVAGHEEALERYLESGEQRLDWDWIELPGQHRDGHEVHLGLSFGETTVAGDHLFTAIIRDITDQKEQERELERRREELNELVGELERSNAELEQFAYAVSHDLKEPLRMVSSYVQLLERRYGDELDEDAGEFVDFAVDGATRMQQMIDDILEFSRVGQDETAHEPVDCNAVLEDLLEMISIEDDGVEVTVETLPTVSGNRTQLTKVFQNLISNAVTHGGADVTVRVSAEREGDEWRVAVSDTGPGIPPEKQEQIFELFNAVGATGGTGVGLAICRKVVEHHDGDIRVDSTPGEGTTFSVTLPAPDTDNSPT